MIKVKNIATEKVTQVKNVNLASDGVLVADVWAAKKSKKFFEIYPMMVATGTTRLLEFKGRKIECDILELASGYVLDTARTRKPRTKKSKQSSAEDKKSVQDMAYPYVSAWESGSATRQEIIVRMSNDNVPAEVVLLVMNAMNTPQGEQEPQPQPAPKNDSDGNANADDVEATLIKSLRALRGNGNTINKDEIRKIFAEELAKYASANPRQVK